MNVHVPTRSFCQRRFLERLVRNKIVWLRGNCSFICEGSRKIIMNEIWNISSVSTKCSIKPCVFILRYPWYVFVNDDVVNVWIQQVPFHPARRCFLTNQRAERRHRSLPNRPRRDSTTTLHSINEVGFCSMQIKLLFNQVTERSFSAAWLFQIR